MEYTYKVWEYCHIKAGGFQLESAYVLSHFSLPEAFRDLV